MYLIEFLLLEVHEGLVNLEVIGKVNVVGLLDTVYTPVIARREALLYRGRYQLGCGHDALLHTGFPDEIDQQKRNYDEHTCVQYNV